MIIKTVATNISEETKNSQLKNYDNYQQNEQSNYYDNRTRKKKVAST